VRSEAPVNVDAAPIRAAVEAVESRLAERGRVVLRPSGTEPVVRVMVEGDDAEEVAASAEEIAAVVRESSIAD
jgi:phosphoglucosamine mutase